MPTFWRTTPHTAGANGYPRLGLFFHGQTGLESHGSSGLYRKNRRIFVVGFQGWRHLKRKITRYRPTDPPSGEIFVFQKIFGMRNLGLLDYLFRGVVLCYCSSFCLNTDFQLMVGGKKMFGSVGNKLFGCIVCVSLLDASQKDVDELFPLPWCTTWISIIQHIYTMK